MGSTNSSGLVIIFLMLKCHFCLLDYVEEPMKYQALRPQFFSVGGQGMVGLGVVVGRSGWWWGEVGGWMVGWGGWVGGGDGGTHSLDMQPCGCFILDV